VFFGAPRTTQSLMATDAPIADPSGRHPPRLALPRWWARAMPPLWQYFSRLLEPDESISAPKRENRGPLSG
jgi:hypothetical protein